MPDAQLMRSTTAIVMMDTRPAIALRGHNPSYTQLLSANQLKLKNALAPLEALVHDGAIRKSTMWPRIEKMLHEFGSPHLDVSNQETYQ